MIEELIRCLERVAPPRPLLPRFENDALGRWYQLHLWSGQQLDPRLPEIRNGCGDAVTLQLAPAGGGRIPRLLVQFRDGAHVPAELGHWVNESLRNSSDANEIRELLGYVEHGEILRPLCDLFGPAPVADDFVPVH